MQAPLNVGELHEINALCNRNESFAAIGNHFCNIFRSKSPGSLCLTLVAMYQEHGSIIHVTQRLVLVYLIYRLKDLGVLGEDKTLERGVDILTHPFLILLVRIYVGCVSPVPTSDSLDALYRLSGFPDVTPQEGNFVGHLLTDDEDNLGRLFEMTPSEVADNPVHEKQDFEVQRQVEVAVAQLEPYKLLGSEGVQDNGCDGKGSFCMPDCDPVLYNDHARLVSSLAPAPFIRIEPNVMPPCEEEFHFIYSSLIDPEQVRDDWVKDEEWGQEKMCTLEKTLDDVKLSHRSSTPSSPATARKDKDRSPPNAWPLANRNFAIEALKKIAAGSGSMLAKADSARIVTILSDDSMLFKEVGLALEDFTKFVETQPDIAAELLFYELVAGEEALTVHLEMILSFDLSVQSIVTVNKFVSHCDVKNLSIPNDFLNRFITLCMDSCDQQNQNQLLINRLVRMVCVFFSAIIRLRNFDIKPRLTEMQNFTTVFSYVKEAGALYQSITQAK